MSPNLDHCQTLIAQNDPASMRVLALLSPEKQLAVLPYIALNTEISAIPSVIKEQALGEIRYQWWRENLGFACDDGSHAHPVLGALAETSQLKSLVNLLIADIDAREALFLASGDTLSLSRATGYCEARGRGIFTVYASLIDAEETAAFHIGAAATAGHLYRHMVQESEALDPKLQAALAPTQTGLKAFAEKQLAAFNALPKAPRLSARALLPYVSETRPSLAEHDRSVLAGAWSAFWTVFRAKI